MVFNSKSIYNNFHLQIHNSWSNVQYFLYTFMLKKNWKLICWSALLTTVGWQSPSYSINNSDLKLIIQGIRLRVLTFFKMGKALVIKELLFSLLPLRGGVALLCGTRLIRSQAAERDACVVFTGLDLGITRHTAATRANGTTSTTAQWVWPMRT